MKYEAGLAQLNSEAVWSVDQLQPLTLSRMKSGLTEEGCWPEADP